MCAINPRFQKHFKLSVYTSNPRPTEEEFMEAVCNLAFEMEVKLNEDCRYRWHLTDLAPEQTTKEPNK